MRRGGSHTRSRAGNRHAAPEPPTVEALRDARDGQSSPVDGQRLTLEAQPPTVTSHPLPGEAVPPAARARAHARDPPRDAGTTKDVTDGTMHVTCGRLATGNYPHRCGEQRGHRPSRPSAPRCVLGALRARASRSLATPCLRHCIGSATPRSIAATQTRGCAAQSQRRREHPRGYVGPADGFAGPPTRCATHRVRCATRPRRDTRPVGSCVRRARRRATRARLCANRARRWTLRVGNFLVPMTPGAQPAGSRHRRLESFLTR